MLLGSSILISCAPPCEVRFCFGSSSKSTNATLTTKVRIFSAFFRLSEVLLRHFCYFLQEFGTFSVPLGKPSPGSKTKSRMYNLPHVPSGSQPFYPPLPAQFLNQLSSQTHLNQLAFNAMSGSAIPAGTSLPNIPDFPVGIVGDGAGVPGAGALPVLNVNGLPVLGGVDGLPVSGPMPQGPLPPLDLNSPEIFRQSIELAKEQVARVEMLTRNVISGMYVSRSVLMRYPESYWYAASGPMNLAYDLHRLHVSSSTRSFIFLN